MILKSHGIGKEINITLFRKTCTYSAQRVIDLAHSLLVPVVLNLEYSFEIYSNVLVNAKKSEIESKFTGIDRMNLKVRVVSHFRSLCFVSCKL